jgi:hypothetical protein
MTTHRLSPAMRSVLRIAITHGRLPARFVARATPTLQALRQRGLLDADNQPTQAGRNVFAPADAKGAQC